LLATSFGEGKFIGQPNLFDGHKLAMPWSLKVLQRGIPKGLKTLLTMELVNNWIKLAMEGHRQLAFWPTRSTRWVCQGVWGNH
jgi:hypothetical protein